VSTRVAVAPGVTLWPERLGAHDQRALVSAIFERIGQAPLFKPTMPGTGKPFSVEMTNFGPLGWVSDQARGYRYEKLHPVTGDPWPDIPRPLLELWAETTQYGAPPEACLVNLYRPGARMGLHRDEDEAATDAPVLSVSLGDRALFRFSGPKSRTPTQTLKLSSGDVLTFGPPARLIYHGIDRVESGTSGLIPGGGRLNLTLRRVTEPQKMKVPG
jgi:alkylated DNA repair protein (DNA oxidative demethylase)